MQYLEIDTEEYIGTEENEQEQLNLFEENTELKNNDKKEYSAYVYFIEMINEKILEKLKEINAYELYKNIDMPTVEVLSSMQWNGMYIDEEELKEFGKELTEKIEIFNKRNS